MHLKRSKRGEMTAQEHYHSFTALRVLGIHKTRREIREGDPEWLLHDAREAYKARIKECHPDKGGKLTDAQALNVAKSAIERILGKRIKRGC